VTPPRFRYGLDPVCLAACALYALNRWGLRPSSGFMAHHFNDLLFVPALLPWVLAAQRALGARPSHAPPTPLEIATHTAAWALLAEVVGPACLHRGVADPIDAACYFIGALAAGALWKSGARLAPRQMMKSAP
jgi:hypothetical protein